MLIALRLIHPCRLSRAIGESPTIKCDKCSNSSQIKFLIKVFLAVSYSINGKCWGVNNPIDVLLISTKFNRATLSKKATIRVFCDKFNTLIRILLTYILWILFLERSTYCKFKASTLTVSKPQFTKNSAYKLLLATLKLPIVTFWKAKCWHTDNLS